MPVHVMNPPPHAGRAAEVCAPVVETAVPADGDIRSERDSYDVTTPTGLRIEVKSAAYLQSWAQRAESLISFDVRETLAWDAATNVFAPESDRRRQAHLYVFALLAHRSKATLNPLDVSQWEFYLVEASVLDEHLKKQRRVSLSRVVGLNPVRACYSDLKRNIAEVEARRVSNQSGTAAEPTRLV